MKYSSYDKFELNLHRRNGRAVCVISTSAVFEIRENNHCGGVIFQAGNPESMLKNPPSTVIISSYFEH